MHVRGDEVRKKGGWGEGWGGGVRKVWCVPRRIEEDIEAQKNSQEWGVLSPKKKKIP